MSGGTARPTVSMARIALGSLIIKEKLGLTDEETVEQISENPYLQYFLSIGAGFVMLTVVVSVFALLG